MGSCGGAPRSKARQPVNREILETIWAHDELADLGAGERRLALRSLLAEEKLPGSVAEVADWVDGWGPLSEMMRDPEVTDVLINGPREVWVERSGSLILANVLFQDPRELRRLVDRLLGDSGVQADACHPIADARIADGARLHVVLPPIAPRGPIVSIRRFPNRSLTVMDLLDRGMFDTRHGEELTAAVRQRRTIAISGGTGTGKTTLLNALLGCVGDDERVVLVEETPELRPSCKHWVSLVARHANVEGRGEIDLATLVRAALRMRPDRIVVGEIRGAEALAALTAMSTGHSGSLLTVHASSGPEALKRIVSLALGARTGLSETALRSAVGTAIDVSVHLERSGGKRRIAAIERLH